MDLENEIRFRVVQVTFGDGKESEPFKVHGSIAEDGLGLLSWWQ
jgi:DNA-directed RNA polymerase subunit E'/Rpb7